MKQTKLIKVILQSQIMALALSKIYKLTLLPEHLLKTFNSHIMCKLVEFQTSGFTFYIKVTQAATILIAVNCWWQSDHPYLSNTLYFFLSDGGNRLYWRQGKFPVEGPWSLASQGRFNHSSCRFQTANWSPAYPSCTSQCACCGNPMGTLGSWHCPWIHLVWLLK